MPSESNTANLPKPMKILIVGKEDFIPEYKDGVTKIIYNLMSSDEFYHADYLPVTSDSNNSVYTNTIFGQSSLSNKIFPPVTINDSHNQYWLKKVARLIRRATTPLPFVPYDRSTYRQIASQIANLFTKYHYDILLLSTVNLAPVIHYLDPTISTKTILSAIDATSLLYRRRTSFETNIFKKMFWFIEEQKAWYSEKKYFQLFFYIHLVSIDDKKYLLQRFSRTLKKNGTSIHSIASKIKVIPNGVNSTDITPNQNSNHLIFIGHYNYGPNYETAKLLIEKIMPNLRTHKELRDHDIKLFIIGTAPDPRWISLTSSKDSPQIIITGQVPSIENYLLNASIFLIPMPYGSGIKNKVLEALAYGQIVIGSPIAFEGITAIKEIPNCITINSLNSDEWARIIKETILSLNAHSAQWHRNSRITMDIMRTEYSWSNIRASYNSLFQDISSINGY